jgi:hypothetical protein
MAVYFEPDYSRSIQTVTHIQFYVESMNSGPIVLCGWLDINGVPGENLAGFPISIPNSQIVPGWNTYSVPVEIRPVFSTGNFFFGINEFSNLPAVGLDEDSMGNSFSNVNGWNSLTAGNLMIRTITDTDPMNTGNNLISNSIEISNYPNPFNPCTTINLDLPKPEKVKLDVFNLKGQLVKSLIDEKLPAGNTQVQWNGMNEADQPVASGVYFYKLKTINQNRINKMLLLK